MEQFNEIMGSTGERPDWMIWDWILSGLQMDVALRLYTDSRPSGFREYEEQRRRGSFHNGNGGRRDNAGFSFL